MLEELNETATSIEKRREAMNEMKSGKAPGMDEFPVGGLIKGCMAVPEGSRKMFNINFDAGDLNTQDVLS